MTRLLAGPLLLLMVTSRVLSSQDNVTVEVLYAQNHITRATGSSLTLSCKTVYDLKKCGLVRAVWSQLTGRSAELTDPDRYFTTVYENVSADSNVRHRQVVTEILHLLPEDAGTFQCKAKCESGQTAMGHFIYITIKGGSS